MSNTEENFDVDLNITILGEGSAEILTVVLGPDRAGVVLTFNPVENGLGLDIRAGGFPGDEQERMGYLIEALEYAVEVAKLGAKQSDNDDSDGFEAGLGEKYDEAVSEDE